jgi:hypothetical protein
MITHSDNPLLGKSQFLLSRETDEKLGELPEIGWITTFVTYAELS